MSAGTAPALAITEPSAAEARAAARVLAEAFLDDPVWVAIGPARRRHRRLANRASFAGILAGCRRHGARIRVARRGVQVLGATISFLPGSWPMPDRTAFWEIPWVFVAGPLPVWRGLRGDQLMRARHVRHPHVYLWFIGVEPAAHGAGVGGALMADVHGAAGGLELPTYLETGTERNVGFYERLGYEVGGELEMPTGVPMWLMERPAERGEQSPRRSRGEEA